VRDRVVQAAVLLILEPIFEADFEDCSYGFRPGRSAHDALRAIPAHLKEGKTAVYDADLAGYLDRQHSPRPVAGLCADAGGGRLGSGTDPTMAQCAGGGTVAGREAADGATQRAGHAAFEISDLKFEIAEAGQC